MQDWQDRAAEKVRVLKRFGDRHIRNIARGLAVIAVPFSVLMLIPVALGLVTPPLEITDLYRSHSPLTFTFLDSQGHVIGHRGTDPGERLTLEQMPPYLPAAFIAMEDRRFYSHNGIDPIGLSRAIYLDLSAGHYVAGGSTISQQTAKIVTGDRRRSLRRKAAELVNAVRLEHALSKREILTLYLNRLYLGDGAYGVDAAARSYFGISARQVSLPQAAMLAALTRAPSIFSPRRDLPAARERAVLVLAAMVQTGAITQAQADAAKTQLPETIAPRPGDSHSYFLDAAADQAHDLAVQSGGAGKVVVHTTFEPNVQSAADAAVQDVIGKAGAKSNVHQAAVAVLKPDGALSAMVGGADYDRSVFNRALQAHRQPGSAFKPFVYLAALRAGISPWDYRDDQPVNIDGYQPSNYKKESFGRLRLTDALARSVNTITVNLAQEVGIANVSATARAMGITSPLQDNASLALGTNEVTPLELTAAYAAFANGGAVVKPYMITEIDAADGAVLYRHQAAPATPVITDQQRRDMVAMLYNVVSTGTGTAARLGTRDAAGKTGTTQDYRDAWFVGFTTDYVTGVWVGNDNDAPMRHITGGSLPALIWKSVMLAAEQGHPPQPLDRSQPPADEPPPLDVSQGFIDEAPVADLPEPKLSDQGEVTAGSGVALRDQPAGPSPPLPEGLRPAPPRPLPQLANSAPKPPVQVYDSSAARVAPAAQMSPARENPFDVQDDPPPPPPPPPRPAYRPVPAYDDRPYASAEPPPVYSRAYPRDVPAYNPYERGNSYQSDAPYQNPYRRPAPYRGDEARNPYPDRGAPPERDSYPDRFAPDW